MDINKYIDFCKLFKDIFKKQEYILEKYKYEASHFRQILELKEYFYDKLELDVEECDYDSKEITFVFGHSNNDANESCTQSSGFNYYIVYDIVLDEFTNCEQY